MSELAVIDRSGWTITADSENLGDGIQKVLDGDTQTFWHTLWQSDVPPPHPHTVTIDMGAAQQVAALKLQPRFGNLNGNIGDYQIEASTDGGSWGLVATGTWLDDGSEKTAQWTPASARYVRLIALSEAGGRGPWTTASEINLLGPSGSSLNTGFFAAL